MSGRDREEFHLTCHFCFGEIHIDCKARPICPRCGKTLEIEWRAVETPRYASVTEGEGGSNLCGIDARDRMQPARENPRIGTQF